MNCVECGAALTGRQTVICAAVACSLARGRKLQAIRRRTTRDGPQHCLVCGLPISDRLPGWTRVCPGKCRALQRRRHMALQSARRRVKIWMRRLVSLAGDGWRDEIRKLVLGLIEEKGETDGENLDAPGGPDVAENPSRNGGST